MKKCPRCGRQTLQEEQALNALSRRDNKTYICSACGTGEAMFDLAIQMERENESAWLHMMGVKK